MSGSPNAPIPLAHTFSQYSEDGTETQVDLETITEHCTEVYEEAENHFSERDLDPTIVKVICHLHDIGKYTEYFQDYIRGTDTNTSQLKNHAFISSIATMYTLHKLGYDSETRLIGFIAVAKHHSEPSNLSNLSEYTDFGLTNIEKKWERVETQAQSIQDNFGTPELFSQFFDSGPSFQEKVTEYAELAKEQQLSKADITEETYQKSMDYWSVLTLSDKIATKGLQTPTGDPLQDEKITTHIQNFDQPDQQLKRELNKHRETARKNALKSIQNADENQNFQLTLPTGFGKTLTGLQAGLQLSNEKDGNLIYALPYTTVIDQTDSIIRKVFNITPIHSQYTIHHHLADTRTVTENIDEISNQKFTGELWQSNLVLTTFVQLLESLAGPVNKQSLKLPALKDSVIILDEPQAITPDWWSLTGRLTEVLNEQYNASVIFMTATQPQLDQSSDYLSQPTQLINPDDHFDFLNSNPRVQFNYHESVKQYTDNPNTDPLPIEEAATEVANTPQTSTLAICNTIDSTIKLSEEVHQELPEDTIHLNKKLQELYNKNQAYSNESSVTKTAEKLKTIATNNPHATVTLTTRLRPIDRQILIETTTKITETDTKLTTISTQLVEAGVDISFDSVYRDFAPLSSIVQAAGRCNRSFEGETRPVTIWRLANTNDTSKPPSELVYASSYGQLRATRQTLKELTAPVSEHTMITTGVTNYYNTLHEKGTIGNPSLVTAVNNANFKALRKESLITQLRDTIDVIVTTNSIEENYTASYKRLIEPTEPNTIDTLLGSVYTNQPYTIASRLLENLKTRTINVPLTKNISPIPIDEDNNLYWINATETSQYELSHGQGLTEANVTDRFV